MRHYPAWDTLRSSSSPTPPPLHNRFRLFLHHIHAVVVSLSFLSFVVSGTLKIESGGDGQGMEEGGRRREEEGEMGNGRRKERYREERKRERKSLPLYHSQSVTSAGGGKEAGRVERQGGRHVGLVTGWQLPLGSSSIPPRGSCVFTNLYLSPLFPFFFSSSLPFLGRRYGVAAFGAARGRDIIVVRQSKRPGNITLFSTTYIFLRKMLHASNSA